MATTIPPLPAPTAPLVDPRTGLISTAWFNWFKAIDKAIRGAGL